MSAETTHAPWTRPVSNHLERQSRTHVRIQTELGLSRTRNRQVTAPIKVIPIPTQNSRVFKRSQSSECKPHF